MGAIAATPYATIVITASTGISSSTTAKTKVATPASTPTLATTAAKHRQQ